MKQISYGIIFSIFGTMLGGYAVWLRGACWLLTWPGASFLLVGTAYLGAGPKLFGKRGDGRFPWWAWVIHGPYLSLTLTVWHMQRFLGREDPFNRVTPDLLLGRRLLPHEIPAEVEMILDLTAELTEVARTVGDREYFRLSILDAGVPREEELTALLERLKEDERSLLVHCALGHGRSGMVVACLLLRRGLVASAEEACRMVRQARPRARMNGAQRGIVEQVG